MIWLTILLEIILFILVCVFIHLAVESYDHEGLFAFLWILFVAIMICTPFLIDGLHGYINYNESNDKDLARITAITQQQDVFKTYYKIEVEYLTNTPSQQGIMQYKTIEKDTFYCYYEDKELVEKIKNHLYEEVWLISGYKGGYETYKDFGTKLLKNIELRGVNNNG